MKEYPVEISKCGSCESVLFTEEPIHLVNKDGITLVSTPVWRCVECGTFLTQVREPGIAQANVVKRELLSRLSDELKSVPKTETIDLNIVTGVKKKPLTRMGGLASSTG